MAAEQSPTVRRRAPWTRAAPASRKTPVSRSKRPQHCLRTSQLQKSVGSRRQRWACGLQTWAALLTAYGIKDRQRRANLLTLTRESRQRGWWEEFSDAIPPELDLAIGLEAEAVSIRIFCPHFVGGLFQTSAYARALLRANWGAKWTREARKQVERRVELRIERQTILEERDRLEIRAVIDETVLDRPSRRRQDSSRPTGPTKGAGRLSKCINPGAAAIGRKLTRAAKVLSASSKCCRLTLRSFIWNIHIRRPILEEESEVELYSDIFEASRKSIDNV